MLTRIRQGLTERLLYHFSPAFLVAILALMVWISLVAFQVGGLDPRVDQIIAGALSFLGMLIGPGWLKGLFDAIGLPGGAVRDVATYVVAVILGTVALFAAGMITGQPTNIEEVLALAGLLRTAASAAYQRLKDLDRL